MWDFSFLQIVEKATLELVSISLPSNALRISFVSLIENNKYFLMIVNEFHQWIIDMLHQYEPEN